MTETIPDRTSNAGPDTPEPPKDWRDHLEDAQDAIRAAKRFYRDDIESERDARRRALQDVIDAVNEAIEVLP